VKETLTKTIEKGELDLYLDLIEKIVEEGHDLAEVAAAATKLAVERGRQAPKEKEQEVAQAHDDEQRVRLSMSVGKRDGIRPGDIVGSIANEANVPGRDIGPIDIRDNITYVEIPARFADIVLEKIARARFRGRNLNARRATGAPPREDRPRRKRG